MLDGDGRSAPGTAGEPGRIRTFQGIGYLLDVDAAASRGREERPAEPEPASAALIG